MADDTDKVRELFQQYVNAATDFAESVKRNIIHDGIIDDQTVNKLNDFIIATNALAEVDVHEVESDNEEDVNLN